MKLSNAISSRVSALSIWAKALHIASLRFLTITIALGALSNAAEADEQELPTFSIETVADGLNFPWSLAVMPDASLLVTERAGGLIAIGNDGQVTRINGLPEDVFIAGQGGWQDVVLSADFANSAELYLSYASGDAQANRLKVVRANFSGERLSDIFEILTISPDKDTPVHYGARLAVLPDGSILVTSGDGFDYREDAQRLDNQMGKILRLHPDGRVPARNPFASAESALTRAVYSYGHRNPQGLVYDPVREVIFAHEHGPAGGDELNLIFAGSNYGWPVVTNGRDYSGATISPFNDYPGMTLPLVDWTPSIAPSGLAVYYGEMFPQLNGDLLIGTLKSRELRWLQMDGQKVRGQVSLLTDLNVRIRDVRVAPDGAIYLLTDSEEGQVLRLTPASESVNTNITDE